MGRSVPQQKVNPPLDILHHLQGLIKGRFSGDDAAVLNLLLEELHALLINVFPAAEDNQIPADNQAEMIPAIHDVLNRIEDLVEAFEMAGQAGSRMISNCG